MATADASGITCLLHAWSTGDGAALEQLMPLVYRELRRTAKRHMAHEQADHILQSGDLVNEVYLHLLRMERISWKDRAHFYAVCAQLMRRILIDNARSRLSVKHGGELRRVPLNETLIGVPDAADDQDELLAIDQALRELATLDQRKSKVLELRIFGGFSVKETAKILAISEDTVTRDCLFAKHWLLRQLHGTHFDGK